MENPGSGKSPHSALSFRYNANNEELEELYPTCEDDPPTPQFDISSNVNSENASPKKIDRTTSIIDKYFKSIRVDKVNEKLDEGKNEASKMEDAQKTSSTSKEVTSSPMKEYLNRLGKRTGNSDINADVKDGPNETWKIFHDFKYKITQAVEDIKSRSVDETREKSILRDSSISDSEDNSAMRDSDQQSVSSLDSSMQNLSELTQAVTAKANDQEANFPVEKSLSDNSDDTHRNMVYNVSVDVEKKLLDDSGMMEVESGVEALEENNMEDLTDNCEIKKDAQEHQQTTACSEQISKCVFSVVKNNIQERIKSCNLRLSYTQVKIGKRALWDDKLESVSFYQHRFYNLTGARLLILPKDLVRKRHWSKKYPICIVLSEKEKIQVLEKEPKTPEKKQSDVPVETKSKEQVEQIDTSEANTSPEKKKKFVWRKKEKVNSQTETDSGKEGLRQRIARRMHRDKKTESASTFPDTSENLPNKSSLLEELSFQEPTSESSMKSLNTIKDEDEELDENELSRIKDFLDDSELEGSAEGEWTVHVKDSRDKHSRLFLFGRTGREKHEWYRRLNTAINEANATSKDSSTGEEGAPSDAHAPTREVEMAVYKLAEKEAIAFAKPTSKVYDAIPEVISVTSASQPLGPSDWESYEKTFWPYLFKIIQSHDTNTKTTSDVGVMCEIDPSPKHWRNRSKSDNVKGTAAPVTGEKRNDRETGQCVRCATSYNSTTCRRAKFVGRIATCKQLGASTNFTYE
ncbi:Testis-expressed protein 2 [Eumeta japonica]|uniref:Testis-expressed protein 2 n=1 Tax=Eumeta variegata TaxID=151549 RepID=A0A4C1XSN7_EUMVA|nr:Testis-expressed protein 2 [Eumeta japonica]